MNQDLFRQLENQVDLALESMEVMRLELEELQAENARLKQERADWEGRLTRLVEKFSALEQPSASPSEQDYSA